MDYAGIGLLAGIEIHQQLGTGKLFSRTPSYLRNDEPDYEIVRKLYSVAGETGEMDEAVVHEASMGKTFVYQGYNDSISLVELDESPPRDIDDDALNEALKIALLLNCEIYPVAQIMRKTVIDGSNTSGFQRTVLIAHSGFIECSFGKVRIDSMCLEEDSARLVSSKKEERVVFRLDRLGIPLIEIATMPDLKTPEQIKECALKLGEVLRACKVKRGIGTIRQDVNISIKGHDRVEIKGFQDPKMMIKTIDLEIERQMEDLKRKKREGEVRNALPDGKTEFLRPMPGKARMYPETDLFLLKIGRDRLNKLKKHLPKLRKEIEAELKRIGVNSELIELLSSDNKKMDEFNVLMKVGVKDANLVAKMITLWRNELSKKANKSAVEIEEILNERILEIVLEHIKDGKLDKNHVKEVLVKVLDGKRIEEALHVEKVGDDELEERIRKMVKNKPGLRAGGYMGLIVKEFGDKLDKRKAMEILNKILNEMN